MIAWVMSVLFSLLSLGAALPTALSTHHLSIAGATSSLAYLRQAVAGWERLHPGYTVSVRGGGSIAGLVEVSRGRVDIGVSDVPPQRQWTQGAALMSVALGRVPLLVIAHARAGTARLSLTQLQAVFTGRINRWSAFGGASTPVIVMTRPLASGALDVMQTHVLQGRRVTARAIVELSNGAMLAAVRETPGAVGFVESGEKPPGVMVLAVGDRQFQPARVSDWPYFVTPTLYWHKQSGSLVYSLARYLSARADRVQYGLYPVAS